MNFLSLQKVNFSLYPSCCNLIYIDCTFLNKFQQFKNGLVSLGSNNKNISQVEVSGGGVNGLRPNTKCTLPVKKKSPSKPQK